MAAKGGFAAFAKVLRMVAEHVRMLLGSQVTVFDLELMLCSSGHL
jgi:hypothetical protein